MLLFIMGWTDNKSDFNQLGDDRIDCPTTSQQKILIPFHQVQYEKTSLKCKFQNLPTQRQ